jgi:hypothetical protein
MPKRKQRAYFLTDEIRASLAAQEMIAEGVNVHLLASGW